LAEKAHGVQASKGQSSKKYISFGTVLNVQKIDDISQNITIDFVMWSYMKHTPKPSAKNMLLKTSMAKLEWVPEFIFFSLTEEAKLILEFVYTNENTGDVYVFQNWILKIQEGLELQKFPFDRQMFSVRFQCINCMYRPFPLGSRSCGPASWATFSDNSTVTVVKLKIESSMWICHKVTTSSMTFDDCTVYAVSMALERRSSYYLWNICLPYFLLGLLALFSYAIPLTDIETNLVADPSSRFNFTMTLILTAVAFKFVTSGLVPKTSYLTLLDKYALGGFFFIVIVMLKDLILALNVIFSEENISVRALKRSDLYFTSAWGLMWILMHIFLLVAHSYKSIQIPWEKVEASQGEDEQVHNDDNVIFKWDANKHRRTFEEFTTEIEWDAAIIKYGAKELQHYDRAVHECEASTYASGLHAANTVLKILGFADKSLASLKAYDVFATEKESMGALPHRYKDFLDSLKGIDVLDSTAIQETSPLVEHLNDMLAQNHIVIVLASDNRLAHYFPILAYKDGFYLCLSNDGKRAREMDVESLISYMDVRYPNANGNTMFVIAKKGPPSC